MSDRKYRQRGYQDEPRAPRREETPAQKKEYAPRGQPPDRPKTFNMPGFREVVRCARCGNELTVAAAWSADAKCNRCGADLHTCAQCANFDTGAAFECQKPIPARISPKDALNTCAEYEPRTTVERETKSTAPTSARKAFDDLFK
jgi:ribosomal protein S27E